VVRLDDGRVIDLSGLVLVGRDPAPAPGETPTQLVSVDDPERSVSKTHLAVGQDGGTIWVLDRNSTNGTRIVDGSGVESALPPGEPVPVQPGCSVRFGARTLTVLAGGVTGGMSA
jgi:predicted component of type VI protein secretion system